MDSHDPKVARLVARYFDHVVAGVSVGSRAEVLATKGLSAEQKASLRSGLDDVDACVLALRGRANQASGAGRLAGRTVGR